MAEQGDVVAAQSLVKLPVWSAVRKTYQFVWKHPGLLALTSLIPGAMLGVLPSLGRFQAVLSAHSFISGASYCIAVAFGALLWHRAVIKEQTSSILVEASLYRPMLRYLVALVVISLILLPLGAFAFGASSLFLLVVLPGKQGMEFFIPLLSLAFVPLFVSPVAVRLGLCLPPIAAGVKDFFIGAAWRISKRSMMRLVFGIALAFLPYGLTVCAWMYVVASPFSARVMTILDVGLVASVVIALSHLLSCFLAAVFLSLAFLRLRPNAALLSDAAVVGR